jgi:esterase/lipase superfamily enzyme
MGTSRSGQRNVLVFIHGFNVTFEEAVRRTAQIAYDLRFDGVPITYSWPSQGSVKPIDYTTDETNVEWTEPHLRRFLVDLRTAVPADVQIDLIAHSMGSRALSKVLRALATENVGLSPFTHVILAAPDIDREVFERDLAPAMVKAAHQTTLYASSKDRALMVSREVHTYARAGQSDPPMVFVPGLDTVDASSVDTDMIGHSYLAEAPALLNDLLLLVRRNLPPAGRHLSPVPQGDPRYWVFPR